MKNETAVRKEMDFLHAMIASHMLSAPAANEAYQYLTALGWVRNEDHWSLVELVNRTEKAFKDGGKNP